MSAPAAVIVADQPVFPNTVGDQIRPLQVGVRATLAAMLPPGDAAALADLDLVLKRFTKSDRYLGAVGMPGAMRHDLDGKPVEPVLAEHARWARVDLNGRLKRWAQKRAEQRAAAQALDAAP